MTHKQSHVRHRLDTRATPHQPKQPLASQSAPSQIAFSPYNLLQLQRAIGNQAVGQLLRTSAAHRAAASAPARQTTRIQRVRYNHTNRTYSLDSDKELPEKHKEHVKQWKQINAEDMDNSMGLIRQDPFPIFIFDHTHQIYYQPESKKLEDQPMFSSMPPDILEKYQQGMKRYKPVELKQIAKSPGIQTEFPRRIPENYEPDKKKRKFQYEDKKIILGQEFMDHASRAEASLTRKNRRKSSKKIQQSINLLKNSPDDKKGFFEKQDFFTTSNIIQFGYTDERKISVSEGITVDSRAPSHESNVSMPFIPTNMTVTPGGNYEHERKMIGQMLGHQSMEQEQTVEKLDSKFVDYLLKPVKELGTGSDKMDKEVEARAFKFLVRVVEPLRREGVFTMHLLGLHQQSLQKQPDWRFLTKNETGILAPIGANKFALDKNVDREQLEKVYNLITNYAKTDFKGNDDDFKELTSLFLDFIKAFESKGKTDEISKKIVNKLIVILIKSEGLEDIDIDKEGYESEGLEEDPFNFMVSRPMGQETHEPSTKKKKKKKSSKKQMPPYRQEEQTEQRDNYFKVLKLDPEYIHYIWIYQAGQTINKFPQALDNIGLGITDGDAKWIMHKFGINKKKDASASKFSIPWPGDLKNEYYEKFHEDKELLSEYKKIYKEQSKLAEKEQRSKEEKTESKE